MIHRGETLSAGIKYWILPDIENRIKNGEIKAFFSSVVEEIRPGFAAVKTPEGSRKVQADFVFILVGFRPDVEHLRRFGVEIDSETLAPLHDPATFETNMKGLFVAGSIVAGKNNNKVFVENGRLHGRAIVESIIKGRS
jgi:thioredoxin reductase (NADPH)